MWSHRVENKPRAMACGISWRLIYKTSIHDIMFGLQPVRLQSVRSCVTVKKLCHPLWVATCVIWWGLNYVIIHAISPSLQPGKYDGLDLPINIHVNIISSEQQPENSDDSWSTNKHTCYKLQITVCEINIYDMCSWLKQYLSFDGGWYTNKHTCH